MFTFNVLAAASAANTQVPDASGNVKALGVGIVLLVAGWYMAKYNFLLYGDLLKKKMENVSWDWVSLMSFLLGFAGVTVILGAPRKGLGFFSTLFDMPQKVFLWFGSTSIGVSVGMWAICAVIAIVTFKKAMKDKGDSIKDMRMGGLCAFAFPLGGMPFDWVSMTIANAVVEMMNGIKS